MRILGHTGDDPAHLVGGAIGDVGSADLHPAAVRVAETQQDRGERALARPARSDHGHGRPGGDLQIDPVQGPGLVGAVADPQPLDPDRGLGTGVDDRRSAVPFAFLVDGDGGRGVQDTEEPCAALPDRPQPGRDGGQRGDDLEGGERGQHQHGQSGGVDAPVLDREHPQEQGAPHRQTGDQGMGPGAQPERGGVAPGHPGEFGVGLLDLGDLAVHGAVGDQVRSALEGVHQGGGQCPPGPRLPPPRPPAQGRRHQRDREPGEQQAPGQKHPAGHVHDGQEEHGGSTGDHRHQRRGEPAHQQVQGGLGVVDQTRDQIARAETAERFGAGQTLVHPDPDLGKSAEGGVVGDQPLHVAAHPLGDTEGPGGDDGHAQSGDRGVVGGGGQHPRGHSQQGHPGAGGGGAEQDPQRETGAPRAGQGDHPS